MSMSTSVGVFDDGQSRLGRPETETIRGFLAHSSGSRRGSRATLFANEGAVPCANASVMEINGKSCLTHLILSGCEGAQ